MTKRKKIVLGCCIALGALAILLVGVWRISIGLYISTIETSPEKLLEYEENADGTLTITDLRRSFVFDGFALKNDCYEIEIPEEIDGMTVTIIGEYAFGGCDHMVKVDIPDSVTTIGDRAFWYSEQLKSVKLRDSVEIIGNEAFSDCRGLKKIDIPDSVTTIGNMAFAYCHSLEEICLPDSVTTIGDQAFWACISLETISLPHSISSMGREALAHLNSLRGTVRLPEGMTTIDAGFMSSLGSGIPEGTYTVEIWIPSTVTTIEGGWARNTSMGTRCIYYAERGSYAASWLKEHEEDIYFFPDEDYKEAIVIY